jgi:hypothetical protein
MKTTQGRRLIAALKRTPMTYGEMQRLGVSTSPQKRVMEQLREDEQVIRAKGADGLVRWRVVRATRWTA